MKNKIVFICKWNPKNGTCPKKCPLSVRECHKDYSNLSNFCTSDNKNMPNTGDVITIIVNKIKEESCI